MRNKVVILSIFFLIANFESCETHSNDTDEKNISGTYTRAFSGPYSNGTDTLRIEKINDATNGFIIFYSSKFFKVINGAQQHEDRKTEKWIALYDERDHILREQKMGKIFLFVAEKNELVAGTAEYKKVKE